MSIGSEDTNPLWFYWVDFTLGIIGCFASLLIILVFIFCKDRRSFAFEVIVYFCIATYFDELSFLLFYNSVTLNVLPDGTDTFMCYAQAFLMIWMELSLIIWSTLISFYIWRSVKYQGREFSLKTMRIVYLLIGFAFPLLVSLLVSVLGKTGISGLWCWIKAEQSHTTELLYTTFLYILVYTCLISNFVFCGLTYYIIRKNQEDVERDFSMEYFKGMISFPFMIFVSWIISSIYRILQIGGNTVFGLQATIVILFQLQGTFNAIIIFYMHGFKKMMGALYYEIKIKFKSTQDTRISQSFLDSP
jgi:hypothetical protein